MSGALTISVAETAKRLGVSRQHCYILVKRADFPAFQIGNRWVVYEQGLADWVKAQAEQKGEIAI